MRALSEKRLSDYMAQQIADEILSGRIAGGTQLKQEDWQKCLELREFQSEKHFRY